MLRSVAVDLLRRRLLDLGYLTRTNDESDDAVDASLVSVIVFAPVRTEHGDRLKSIMSSRRLMARKKGRSLLPAEEREAVQLQARLDELQQRGASGAVPNRNDEEWLERDLGLLDAMLMSGGAGTLREAFEREPHRSGAVEDHEPYTFSHRHFTAHEDELRAVLQVDKPGQFYIELAARVRAELSQA